MRSALTRRRIETTIAAMIAIAAGIVGIATRETQRALGPKFIAVDRLTRLKDPVYLTQPPGPGSQLYVVQRQGTVRVLASDRLLTRPFLKISDLVRSGGGGGADGGMTSIAFPPDYARSGLFYVAYTDHRDQLVLARYSRSASDPLVADRASGQVILTVPESKPQRHGGFITFGPDGYLYVGTGDGSAPGDPHEVAQDSHSLRGKILRMNPAQPTPEVWASGLGDPRRISFDRSTKTVGIADVGDQRFEEIQYLPTEEAAGANFGWPAYDGFVILHGGVQRSLVTFPAIAFSRRRGCAVIGGYLVRDPRLARITGRELNGSYLYGMRCSGKLFAFRPRPGRRPGKLRSFRFRFRNLTSLGQDKDGRIYVITEKGPYRHGKPTLGSVFRLVPKRKGL